MIRAIRAARGMRRLPGSAPPLARLDWPSRALVHTQEFSLVPGSIDHPDLVVVGSGFFGLTIAERCATELGLKVLVLERRHHLGGNAYSEIEPETGIEVHKSTAPTCSTPPTSGSGSTSTGSPTSPATSTGSSRKYQGQVYSFPMNLGLINQFFGKATPPTRRAR